MTKGSSGCHLESPIASFGQKIFLWLVWSGRSVFYAVRIEQVIYRAALKFFGAVRLVDSRGASVFCSGEGRC